MHKTAESGVKKMLIVYPNISICYFQQHVEEAWDLTLSKSTVLTQDWWMWFNKVQKPISQVMSHRRMYQPTVFWARWTVPSAGLGPDAGTPEHWEEDVQEGERARHSGASGVMPFSPFSYPVRQTRASLGPAPISGPCVFIPPFPPGKVIFTLQETLWKVTSSVAPNSHSWGLAGSPLQAPITAFLTPLWPTAPVIDRRTASAVFQVQHLGEHLIHGEYSWISTKWIGWVTESPVRAGADFKQFHKSWKSLQIFKESLKYPCNTIKKYGLDYNLMAWICYSFNKLWPKVSDEWITGNLERGLQWRLWF